MRLHFAIIEVGENTETEVFLNRAKIGLHSNSIDAIEICNHADINYKILKILD